jgi:hypothetical protein
VIAKVKIIGEADKRSGKSSRQVAPYHVVQIVDVFRAAPEVVTLLDANDVEHDQNPPV